MPFVNELIPDHDFALHRFEELDESYIVGAVHSTQWVIDREAGTYLLPLTRGREDQAAFADWVLGVGGGALHRPVGAFGVQRGEGAGVQWHVCATARQWIASLGDCFVGAREPKSLAEGRPRCLR